MSEEFDFKLPLYAGTYAANWVIPYGPEAGNIIRCYDERKPGDEDAFLVPVFSNYTWDYVLRKLGMVTDAAQRHEPACIDAMLRAGPSKFTVAYYLLPKRLMDFYDVQDSNSDFSAEEVVITNEAIYERHAARLSALHNRVAELEQAVRNCTCGRSTVTFV